MTATAQKCPRRYCRELIPAGALCCAGCYESIPATIRRDLESEAIRAHSGRLEAAKAAALRSLALLARFDKELPDG